MLATRRTVAWCALVAVLALTPSCGESDPITADPTPTRVPMAVPTATPARTPVPCEGLDGGSIGGAETTARLVAGTATYPEYCKVLGTIAPRLKFEVRLPSDWNRRALFIGGGGLNGVIPSPEGVLFNPSIAADGYATIATDSGHQGSPLDGSWALNDPLAEEDFADGATPKVLDAAREVMALRYGHFPERTYFIGSSTGGREGLIAAQRRPDAFDGIVAMEPVYDFTALVLAGNRIAQQVYATPGGRLSPAHLQTLASAVLAACDGLDGLDDGIISHVAACHLDPAVLRCDGPGRDDCLTDAQIATVNLVHAEMPLDFTLANGVDSYPGWPIGHEDNPGGWQGWIVGARADPSSSLGFVLPDQVLRFMVARDPALDTLQFSANEYVAELRMFSVLFDATNPDLSAFAAGGGKLILWHGLADYGVSARSTTRYYERVVETMGVTAVDGFLRLYLSPGVDHLGGGPGPGSTDFLSPLIAWVEAGTAPEDLISHELQQGTTDPILSRPLCRYPRYPRYNGSGDADDAASFHCAD